MSATMKNGREWPVQIRLRGGPCDGEVHYHWPNDVQDCMRFADPVARAARRLELHGYRREREGSNVFAHDPAGCESTKCGGAS